MKTLLKKVSVIAVVASLAMAGVLVFADQGTALADSNPPAATFTDSGDIQLAAHLASAYQADQTLYAQIGAGLSRASLEVTDAQNLIDQLSAQSLDVSGLQDALSTFQGHQSASQQAYDNVTTVISAHKGFNDAGQVYDLGDARNTVSYLSSFLGNADGALNPALSTFENTIHEYAHPSSPIPVTGSGASSSNTVSNVGPVTFTSLAQTTVVSSITSAADIQKALHIQKYFAVDDGLYQSEAGMLFQASTAINRATNQISFMNSQGKDSGVLQQALAGFQDRYDAAKTSYATAGSLIDAHNGFNDLGQVIDLNDGATTLSQLSSAVNNVDGLLNSALAELNNTINLSMAQ